jgi:hypothetical protein
MWEAGSLDAEALGFDPRAQKWIPLGELLAAIKENLVPTGNTIPPRPRRRGQKDPLDVDKFIPPVKKLAPLPPERSGKHLGVKHRNAIRRWQVLWILSVLVGVLVSLGLFFWANAAIDERNSLNVRIDTLNESLRQKNGEIERLRQCSRENLETDEIQGRVVLRSPGGGQVAQSGIKILLYNSQALERHLEQVLRHIPEGTRPEDAARGMVNGLPFPITTTTTDSNGFYHLRLQEPGEYILHTNIIPKSGDPLLWFLSFDSRQPGHARIDFTEGNLSARLVPGLVVTPAR